MNNPPVTQAGQAPACPARGGRRTYYEYSLTAMGFKEDILVLAYTGQTEYSFTLQTGGLTAVNQSGTWVLLDGDNTVRASLSDVIVFTADERNNTFGELRVEEITAGQTYRLTVVLDADWLADPKTVYPITIDPSVTYTDTTGNSLKIEDLVVGTSTTYNGYSGSLYVGRGASGAKIRTLMRFPNLNISGYNITEAWIELRDLMCETTSQDVECWKYTGNSWQESTSIAWTAMGDTPLGVQLSKKSVVYKGLDSAKTGNIHRFAFDITPLAQEWANGIGSPANGVIFKATDDYEEEGTKTFKTFASANRSSNQPSLEIQYIPAITLSPLSSEIMVGETLTLTTTLVAHPDLTLTYTSSNNSIATVSDTGVVTGVSAGTVTITASDTAGNSGSCTVKVVTPNYSVQFVKKVDYITGANGSTSYWYPEVTVTPASAAENLRYAIYCTEEYRGAMSYNTITGTLLAYRQCMVVLKVYFVDRPEVYDLCYVYADMTPTILPAEETIVANRATGLCLTYNSNVALTATVYENSTSQKWEFITMDADLSTCMIRSYDNNKYLCCDSAGNISYKALPTTVFIPNEYLWRVDTSGVQSIESEYWLSRNSSGNTVMTSATYVRAQWNSIHLSQFNEITEVDFRMNLELGVEQQLYSSITPVKATWSNRTDFEYTTSSSTLFPIQTNGYATGYETNVYTVTMKHKLTGKVFTETIEIVFEEGLYSFQESVSNKYLHDRDETYDEYVTVEDLFDYDEKGFGRQLWYVTGSDSASSIGTYYIYSLGTRNNSTYAPDMALCSSNSSVKLVAKTDSSNFRWRIGVNTLGYYFKCNSMFMNYNAGDTLFDMSSSLESQFTAYSADDRGLPTALFGVEFEFESDVSANKNYIVNIHSSFSQPKISESHIETAVKNWSEYLEKYDINICMNDDASEDMLESACIITIKNMSAIPSEYHGGLGITLFHDKNGEIINKSLSSGKVASITIAFDNLNNYNESSSITEHLNEYRNKLIMHELGHAIGLAHPHENYINVDLNGVKYWTVLAMMNQGLFEEKHLISAFPSGFDLWNLDKRWGN